MRISRISSYAAACKVAVELNETMAIGEVATLAGCTFTKSNDGEFRICDARQSFLARFDIVSFGEQIIWLNRKRWNEAIADNSELLKAA